MHSRNVVAGELLLRSINPLQFYDPLLVVQVIRKRAQCTIAKQEVDLLQCELLRFLQIRSA